MEIEIIKSSGRAMCRGDCKMNPEYVDEKGNIKKGNSCAKITIWGAKGGASAFYCRDCIDTLYEDVRKILNPKLWLFQ